MFTKASIKLAAWYVAILMVLCLAFSFWVYSETVNEARASIDTQLNQPFMRVFPRGDVVKFLQKQFEATRGRTVTNLILLNSGVLIFGSAIGYALARRTLQPIEEAVEAQNRFTADASHELRTPLSAMKTEIEVALRDPKLSKEEMREILVSNVEEVDRLNQLADGLLVLARPGEPMELEKLDIAKIARESIDRWQTLATAKGISITADINNVIALGDKQATSNIIGILLDNAIKYGPSDSKIEFIVSTQDNHACITVHNEGQGIAASDLPHIFDRFYRADTSRTKNATNGHGLGLSIAQKLAIAMRGNIGVRSKPNQGATFTLRLMAS
jgi:signal transduction histidine kinase